MRTIKLELLRHGPAHNQLLSPLTPYLALCENHSAVTLHVPFEHNQFLYRLSGLNYKTGEESRLFQLQDTAKLVCEILSRIPGLTAESNKKDGDSKAPLTHLRLIISASELALIPFELSLSPNGCPGAGQYLVLQSQTPFCITREIRRVPEEGMPWPDEPRILFAAAAPPGIGSIPLEAHLQSLRNKIEPWIRYFRKGDAHDYSNDLDHHLTFLPNASIEDIEHACATNNYTHVHILAHGIQKQVNYDNRFFLAMHDALDRNQVDLISGTRLAAALHTASRIGCGGLSSPTVVTLASCNSSDGGSVAGAGSSIAHALHESGIPMVVAGQFPLSFEGSVRMTEILYEGLLWGEDPRKLLHNLRCRLYAEVPDKHDWASVTAYVSFPENFDSQLASVKVNRARHSVDVALKQADETTARSFERIKEIIPSRNRTTSTKTTATKSATNKDMEFLQTLHPKIEERKKKLKRLVDCPSPEKSRIYGLLASTEKRQSEVLCSMAWLNLKAGDGSTTPSDNMTSSIVLLRVARDHYWQAFLLNRSNSWAVVQYLSLTIILEAIKSNAAQLPASFANAVADLPEEKDKETLWSMSKRLSELDLHSQNRDQAAWAHGNLMELYLLTLLLPENNQGPSGRPSHEEAKKLAVKHAEDLAQVADPNSFEISSTRRQIVRYVEWFSEIVTPEGQQPSADFQNVINLANEILQKLPEKLDKDD